MFARRICRDACESTPEACLDLTNVIRTQTPFLFFDKFPVWRNVEEGDLVCVRVCCPLPLPCQTTVMDANRSHARLPRSVTRLLNHVAMTDIGQYLLLDFLHSGTLAYGSRSSVCLDCDVVLCSGIGIGLSLRVQIIKLLAKNSMESLLTEF